ncbi:MAG: type II toxin-antitoxin system VapC family toxin [Deltaproteobacteria bacterium]|nr:type II toxin-antitoxin system VapC family toxin [Deltaproteobacteria bacterium]
MGIVYWDACVWISLLTNSKCDTFEQAGIDEVIRMVDSNEITLITSVITRIEILRGKVTDNITNKYLHTLENNPSVEEIEVHRYIAQKAHEIRSYYKKEGRNISTPDVIHIATAISENADELHTFDGDGKKNGLLDYNGEEGINNLVITKPSAKQGSFDCKITKPDKEK